MSGIPSIQTVARSTAAGLLGGQHNRYTEVEDNAVKNFRLARLASLHLQPPNRGSS
jgi:hypothetical protein